MATNRLACLATGLGLMMALAGCGGGGGSGGHDNDNDNGQPTPCTTAPGFVDEVGADQNVKTGSPVQLDGTASRGAGGAAPHSYRWSFIARPTGSRATLSSRASAAPYFVADQAGTYRIKLVIDGQNDCDAQTDSLTVTATAPGDNGVPAADAGPDQSVNVGSRVALDGSTSRDPDGDVLTYTWQFVAKPNGSRAELDGAKTVSPSFTADKTGAYVVGLRVNDGSATSPRDEVRVVAAAPAETAPVADAGPDQAVKRASIVRLDGTGSRDANDRLLSYAWHFVSRPEGSDTQLTGADTAQPVFQPDVVGSYVASLVVDNGQRKSRPDTVIVIASSDNVRPVADAGADQNVQTGIAVGLDGSASRDPDGDDLAYRWSIVSLPDDSQTALIGETTATPLFTPDLAGAYVLQLVVDDGRLGSRPDTVVITASAGNSAPVADAGRNRNVGVESEVRLDGSASSDADGDALSYHWTLISRPSDSRVSLRDADSATPRFTADKLGFYAMTLTVNDGQVASTPDLVVITASPTLALYVDRSGTGDDYQRVDGSEGSASIQVPVGGQDVLLDRFRVKALGSDFTIGDVRATSATTDGGQTIEPYFDGLSSGGPIGAGDRRDFVTRLRSVPDAPGQYQVQLQFTASPSGKMYRFTYNVIIK